MQPSEVSFLVLGPLEVRVGGRQARLGGQRPRRLLATLLLDAGKVVPVERLVDAVWGESPPATATAQVQILVSELRRTLGPAGAAVETHPRGYLLRVRPHHQLDLEAFDQGVRGARQARARGEPAAAAEGLRAALGLWRGQALGGVTGALVAGARARLEERRLAALEERVELDLALGRHADLLAELSGLVAEHPLRERPRAQLMLALYRSGRQADALAAYADARRSLVEELGLEPGPDLRRLQRAILEGDPRLATRSEAPPAAEPEPAHAPAPAQLPPDTADFTGRDRQARQLRELLAGPAGGPSGEPPEPPAALPVAMPVVALAGTAGVGKTALALHVAHRVRDHFPDGQLYVNLHGTGRPLGAGQALAGFLRALGVAPQAVPEADEERAALYRTKLAGWRVLIVLDDALDAAQVRPLLPGEGGCGVLVTSRSRLADLEGASQLDLDVLGEPEALDLLARICGPARVAAERDAATAVVNACGCLPLAVRIAGSRLAARPAWGLRELADRIQDEQRRLDELRVGDLGVRASFQVSYRSLAAEEARAFRLLGLMDGRDAGLPAAAALLDRPAAAVEGMLERLVDAHLLLSPGAGRYRFHDLLRLFARERGAEDEPAAERYAAVRRVLDFYLDRVSGADLVLRPGRPAEGEGGGLALGAFADAAAAYAWLDAERANLVAAVEQAVTTPGIPASLPARLAAGMRSTLDLRGYWEDWERVARASLAAARRQGDDGAEVLARNELGALALRRYRLEEAVACFEWNLAVSRRLGDLAGEARDLNNLGGVYRRQRHLDNALECFQRCIQISGRVGYPRIEASAQNGLGMLRRQRGQLGHAVAAFRRSIELYRDIGDRDGEANALGNLGLVAAEQGRHQEAIGYHQRVLGLLGAHGNRLVEGYALANLGAAYAATGATARAVEYLNRSVRIRREIGDRHGEAEALRQLGGALDALDRHEAARTCWLRALDLFERLAAPEAGEVRALLRRAGQRMA